MDDRYQIIMREQWEAFSAMRNHINMVVPMPSEESDLKQGPTMSVSCAVVAEAVIRRVLELEDEIKRLKEKYK